MPGPEDGVYYAGATVKDGKLDLSRAVKFEDTKKLDASVKKVEERNQAERAERMAIPESVKPGTAERVWFELRNTVMVNEEVTQKGGPAAKVANERIQQFQLEKNILNVLVRRRLTNALTTDQASEVNHPIPAQDAADILDTDFIAFWQKLQTEKSQTTSGLGDGKVHPIPDLLKAADDLHHRLIVESSRK